MSIPRSESNASTLRRSGSGASHRNLLPEPGEARESGVALQGSSLTFYHRTLDNNPDWPGVKNFFASISAQAAYRKHSVEELRAIDYARAGSARAKYTRTHDLAANPPLAFLAISAMPAYSDVCQEEIRLADYWYHPTESGIATFNELLSFGRAPAPREVSVDDPFPPAWSDPDKVKEDGFAVVPPEGVSGFEFIAPPMPPTLGPLVEPSSPNESSPKATVVDDDEVEGSAEEPTSLLKQLQEMMRQAQQIKKGDDSTRLKHLRETAAMFNRTLGLDVPSADYAEKNNDAPQSPGVQPTERNFEERSKVDDESDEEERRKSFRDSSQFPSVLQLPDSPSSAESAVHDATDVPENFVLPGHAGDPFANVQDVVRVAPYPDDDVADTQTTGVVHSETEPSTNVSSTVVESESDSDTLELDQVSNAGSMQRPRPFIAPRSDAVVSDSSSDVPPQVEDDVSNVHEERQEDREVEEPKVFETTPAVIPRIESNSGPFELSPEIRRVESMAPVNQDDMDVRGSADEREEDKHANLKRMDSFLEDAAAVAKVGRTASLVRTKSTKARASRSSSKKSAHSIPLDAPNLPVMPDVNHDSAPDTKIDTVKKALEPELELAKSAEQNRLEVSAVTFEPSVLQKTASIPEPQVKEPEETLAVPVLNKRPIAPPVTSPMDAPDLPAMPVDIPVSSEPAEPETTDKTAKPPAIPPSTVAKPTLLPEQSTLDSAPAHVVQEASVSKFVNDRPRVPARGQSRFNIGTTETKRGVARSGSRGGIHRSTSTKSARSSNAMRKASSVSGIARANSRANISRSVSQDQTQAGPKKKPKRSREDLETTQANDSNAFGDSKAFSISVFSNKPFTFGNDNHGQVKNPFVPASISADSESAKLSNSPFEKRTSSPSADEATSKPNSNRPTPSTSYDDFASRAAAAMLGSKSTSVLEHSEQPHAVAPVFTSAVASPFESVPTTSFDSSNARTSFDERASAASSFDSRSKTANTFDKRVPSPTPGPFDTESRSRKSSFDSRMSLFEQKSAEQPFHSQAASAFGTDKRVSPRSFGVETRNTAAPLAPKGPPSFPKFQGGPSSGAFQSIDLNPAPTDMMQPLPRSTARAKSFPASSTMSDAAPEFPPASQRRPVSMTLEDEPSNNMFRSAFQLFEKRTTEEMGMGMDVAPAVLPPAPFATRKPEQASSFAKFEAQEQKYAPLKKKEVAREFALPAKKREPEVARHAVPVDAYGNATGFSAVKRVLEERVSQEFSMKPQSPQPMSASNSEDSIVKMNTQVKPLEPSETAKFVTREPVSANANVFDIWRQKVDGAATPASTELSEKTGTRTPSPVNASSEPRSGLMERMEEEKEPAPVEDPGMVMLRARKKWATLADSSGSKGEPGSTAFESPTSSGKSGAKDQHPIAPSVVPPPPPPPPLPRVAPPPPPVSEPEFPSKPTSSEAEENDGDTPQSMKSILSNRRENNDDDEANKGPRQVSFRDLESVAIADHDSQTDAGGLDTIQKPAPLPPYGNDTAGVEASEGSDSEQSDSAEFQDCLDTIPASKGKDGFWSKAFTSAKSRAEAAEDEMFSRENSMASLKLRKPRASIDSRNGDSPNVSDSIARRIQMFQANANGSLKPEDEGRERAKPRSVHLPKPPAVISDPEIDDSSNRRNVGVLKNISDRFFGPKKSDAESPQDNSRTARLSTAKQTEKRSSTAQKSTSRKTIPKPVASSSRTSVRDVLSSKPSVPKPPSKSSTRPNPPSTSAPPPPPPPPSFLRAGAMGERKLKPPKPPPMPSSSKTATSATEDSKATSYQEKLDGTKKTSSSVRKSSSAHSGTAVKSKSRTRNTIGASNRIRPRKSEEVRKNSDPVEKISIPTPMGDVEFESPKAKSFGHLDNVSLPKKSKSRNRNARERELKVGSSSSRRREEKASSDRAQNVADSGKPTKSKSSRAKPGISRSSFRSSNAEVPNGGASSTGRRNTTAKKQLRDGQNDVKRSAKHQGPKTGRRRAKPGVSVQPSRSVSDLGKKSKRMDSNTESVHATRAHSDIFRVPPPSNGPSPMKEEYDTERDASSLAVIQTPGVTRQMSLTRRHSLPSRGSTDAGGLASLLPSSTRNRRSQPRTHTMLAALWGQGMGRDDSSYVQLKSRRASTDLDEERVRRLRQNGVGGEEVYEGDRGGLMSNVRRLFSRRTRRKERERAGVQSETERASIAEMPEQRQPRGSITRGSLGGMRGSTQRGSTGMRGSLNSVRNSTTSGRRDARRAKSDHKNGRRRGVLFKSQ